MNQGAKKKMQNALEAAPIVTEPELTIANHPTLPKEALFGTAGKIAIEATRCSEADPAAVLATALTYAGAAFGANPHVRVGETKHPPRLYCAIVDASSRARKGTSYDPVRRVFEGADNGLAVSPGPASTGEGLIYAVRDASEAKDKESNQPLDPGVSDKRLLVIESELGAVLKVLQREGNTLSAILRSAWDHGNLAPLTKNNRQKATAAHISVVGHITQNELHALLQSVDVFNGTANRIIWIAARRQKIVPFPQPMEERIVNEIQCRLRAAVELAQSIQAPLLLSEEAENLWEVLYRPLTQDFPGVLGAITSRGEAQVMRLAIIYALLDHSVHIRREHLAAAEAFWSYSLASAKYIFGEATADPIGNRILEELSTGEKTQTGLNDLFGGHQSKESLRKNLSSLQDSGRISQRKEGGRKDGRALTIWFLTAGFSN